MFDKNNQLYKEVSALRNSLYTFEVSKLQILFDNTWQKIGINLSGGADSACLTTLLCDHIQNLNLSTKVYIITYIRCWNTKPWQQSKSIEIYNKLKTIYPTIIQDQIFCYIPPELEHGTIGNVINGKSVDQILTSSFNHYASFTYDFNAIFNATSKNPSNTEFKDRMRNRDVDVDNPDRSRLFYLKSGVLHSNPFTYVEKDWIIAQYKIFNRWQLFEETRSCEGTLSSQGIREVVETLEEYKPGIELGVCETCFWCKERKWAIDNLENVMVKIKDTA